MNTTLVTIITGALLAGMYMNTAISLRREQRERRTKHINHVKLDQGHAHWRSATGGTVTVTKVTRYSVTFVCNEQRQTFTRSRNGFEKCYTPYMPEFLCMECGKAGRHERDLLCEACRARAFPIRRAGFTNVTSCKCKSWYTCDRATCELDMFECMGRHYRHECEHVWEGEWEEFDGGGSVTCSRCGMTAMAHDCAHGP